MRTCTLALIYIFPLKPHVSTVHGVLVPSMISQLMKPLLTEPEPVPHGTLNTSLPLKGPWRGSHPALPRGCSQEMKTAIRGVVRGGQEQECWGSSSSRTEQASFAGFTAGAITPPCQLCCFPEPRLVVGNPWNIELPCNQTCECDSSSSRRRTLHCARQWACSDR